MRSWRRTALAALAFAWVLPAAASSLRIAPIGLDLTVPEKAGAISLTNTGDEPVNLQVRIFKWSQADGKDELTGTRDVIVSPPVATINAGQTYTVRAVRVSARPVQGEEAYRLIVDELPKPIDPRATGQGVRMVLRSSMPVFFTEKDIRPDLTFAAWTEGGKTFLQVTNAGKRHVKLAGMKLLSDRGELSFGPGLNGYVLAGQTMRLQAATDSLVPPPAVVPDTGGRSNVQPVPSVPAKVAGTRLAAGPVDLVSGIGSSIDIRRKVTVEAR